MKSIQLFNLPNFPLIKEGDNLPEKILGCAAEVGQTILSGDVVVIAQKVVSKSEGRLVRIVDVTPSPEAIEIASKTGKDPRAVQVVLSDSNEVLRVRPGLLVVEQKSGWICANAGVDRSNIQPAELSAGHESDPTDEHANDILALLPVDSDASASRIRAELGQRLGLAAEEAPAVLIIDSHGRAWRSGTVGICIGCAGLPPIWDQRGLHDLFGYELVASEECIADEMAAAASLLMGQSDEGTPVVVIRGYTMPANATHAPATSMQRPKEMDAFR